ncbi:MAG: hypothetical protein EBV34_09180 [Betaproteobacteria bacterium]|nr:hypothetical protein [Betaproteobacteria bacterium]
MTEQQITGYDLSTFTDSTQVEALTAAQVAVLTANQLKTFTTKYVAGLEAKDIPFIVPDRIPNLSTTLISLFSAAQVKALTPDQ